MDYYYVNLLMEDGGGNKVHKDSCFEFKNVDQRDMAFIGKYPYHNEALRIAQNKLNLRKVLRCENCCKEKKPYSTASA